MQQTPVAQAVRSSVTVEALIEDRLRTVAEVKRLEAVLGKARIRGRRARRGGLVALHLERREKLKLEYAARCERLRTLNAAIKSGRRIGMLLLLHGTPAPANVRELVAALYRLYVDAVPPIEHDAQQKQVMGLARDFVTSGAFPAAS
jgi:hypothetical protein